MRLRVAVIVAVCALLPIAGCRKQAPPNAAAGGPETRQGPDQSTPAAGATGKLTILCGNSFQPPMEELRKRFEEQSGVTVEMSIGQSEDLLPAVKVGKEGDVYVSHDPYMEYTKEANAYLDGVQVGYVAPVLVVRKGNPANVKSLEDLAKPGVKVALPDPQYATCGKMLFALLEKKGINDAVEANAGGAIFRSHSDTGTALTVGKRDAGVMWNGTAHTFKDSIDVVPTPYEYDETIRVWVMGLSYTQHPDLVKQFLEFVRAEGPQVFADFGYTK